jgi:hypothetical protein
MFITEFQLKLFAFFVVSFYLATSAYTTYVIIKHEPKVFNRVVFIFMVWYFPFFGSMVYALSTIFNRNKASLGSQLP